MNDFYFLGESLDVNDALLFIGILMLCHFYIMTHLLPGLLVMASGRCRRVMNGTREVSCTIGLKLAVSFN